MNKRFFFVELWEKKVKEKIYINSQVKKRVCFSKKKETNHKNCNGIVCFL
jgi:hypothetical protein